ncbi:MAG: hypothetical protein HY868_04975 [Chloroflexi bacterium]|nr:hypothetical protein [Chloroflexota bacterium]
MIQLTTTAIEKQIANYKLQFDSVKDDEIEWKYQPPPFVAAFVAFVEQCRRVPSQTEFADYYFARHREELHQAFEERWRDQVERNRKKRALVARLKRAYPSFVRDLYLFALLREHGIAVEYDAVRDIESGVDLLVTRNRRTIQVHVFLDSPRAQKGRAKKNTRHAFAGEHLDVVLCREHCNVVGAFWLPTLRHVEQIKAVLKEA